MSNRYDLFSVTKKAGLAARQARQVVSSVLPTAVSAADAAQAAAYAADVASSFTHNTAMGFTDLCARHASGAATTIEESEKYLHIVAAYGSRGPGEAEMRWQLLRILEKTWRG